MGRDPGTTRLGLKIDAADLIKAGRIKSLRLELAFARRRSKSAFRRASGCADSALGVVAKLRPALARSHWRSGKARRRTAPVNDASLELSPRARLTIALAFTPRDGRAGQLKRRPPRNGRTLTGLARPLAKRGGLACANTRKSSEHSA